MCAIAVNPIAGLMKMIRKKMKRLVLHTTWDWCLETEVTSFAVFSFLIFEKHLIGTLLLFAQSVYFGPYYTSFSRIMSGKSIITGNSSMSRLWTNLHMIILVIRSWGRKKKAEGKRKVYMQDFFQRGGEGVRFQIRLIEFKAI